LSNIVLGLGTAETGIVVLLVVVSIDIVEGILSSRSRRLWERAVGGRE
jgi:hypothetical protein